MARAFSFVVNPSLQSVFRGHSFLYRRWSSKFSLHSSSKTLNFDVLQHLASLGYTDQKVCKGMAAALEAIHGKVTEATISNFGATALQKLAESVEKELSNENSAAFIGTIHFVVKHHNFSFDLPCSEGESLMTLAKSQSGQELLGEYLECACGGQLLLLQSL